MCGFQAPVSEMLLQQTLSSFTGDVVGYAPKTGLLVARNAFSHPHFHLISHCNLLYNSLSSCDLKARKGVCVLLVKGMLENSLIVPGSLIDVLKYTAAV